MKTLVKKSRKISLDEKPKAQCCAKNTKNQVGCHD
jgi:hypothetical protein